MIYGALIGLTLIGPALIGSGLSDTALIDPALIDSAPIDPGLVDQARYLLALAVVLTLLPALAYWVLAHSWVGLWRRLPPAVTFIALFVVMAVVGWELWAIRGSLLAVRFAWSPWLLPPAVLCLAAAGVVEVQCRRVLDRDTLFGVPELVAGAPGQGLLVEGIYSRVRHPRYLAVLLGLGAVACFSNYLIVWILLPVFGLGIHGVILLEERELAERFGDTYRDYQRRVPRLLPTRRR